jgi:hypothetical protein
MDKEDPLPIESDEFIPERYIKGEPDQWPYIILWLILIVAGVIWAAT